MRRGSTGWICRIARRPDRSWSPSRRTPPLVREYAQPALIVTRWQVGSGSAARHGAGGTAQLHLLPGHLPGHGRDPRGRLPRRGRAGRTRLFAPADPLRPVLTPRFVTRPPPTGAARGSIHHEAALLRSTGCRGTPPTGLPAIGSQHAPIAASDGPVTGSRRAARWRQALPSIGTCIGSLSCERLRRPFGRDPRCVTGPFAPWQGDEG